MWSGRSERRERFDRPIYPRPRCGADAISRQRPTTAYGHQRLNVVRPLLKRDTLEVSIGGAIVDAADAGKVTRDVAEHGFNYVRHDTQPLVQVVDTLLRKS